MGGMREVVGIMMFFSCFSRMVLVQLPSCSMPSTCLECVCRVRMIRVRNAGVSRHILLQVVQHRTLNTQIPWTLFEFRVQATMVLLPHTAKPCRCCGFA